MTYKSRGNYTTGASKCRPNCQCYLCRLERKEKEEAKKKEKKECGK